MRLQPLKTATLAFSLVAGGGCLAAAGAGLGAGIYVSDRGAESLVATPIDRTFAAAQQVFAEMGLTEQKTRSEQSGSTEERELSGKRGDKNVMVNLRTEGQGTRVEVVVSEDMVIWDKDLAKEILEQIAKKTT